MDDKHVLITAACLCLAIGLGLWLYIGSPNSPSAYTTLQQLGIAAEQLDSSRIQSSELPNIDYESALNGLHGVFKTDEQRHI